MTSSVSSAGSATTATFETALVFNAAVFGIELGLFTLLRPYFKQIYEPRAVTPVESQRVKPFVAGMFTWPVAVFKADYRDIQRVNGPDAYLFVRFLRMMIRVLLPIWIISWIVLLPVTSVNNPSAKTGLDRFIFGNVSVYQQDRFAAHIILVWLFTFWIYWNIRREMRHFVTVRQLHLIDPAHSRTAQANTILVTGIPAKYLSEHSLQQLYSHLPGGVKKIWLNRDLKELPSVYDRRFAACGKLESAETSLLSTAAKIRAKALKKSGKQVDGAYTVDSADQAERDVSLAERLVPRDQRPTHRLPAGFMPFSLPLIGKKVDTIDWCRNEIATTTALLRQGRETVAEESPLPVPDDTNGDGKVDSKDRPQQNYPPLNSAFVTFNQQISAHMAYRTLAHHEPYRMADRYLEVAPEDVLWGNLGMNPYEKRIRMAISYAATAGLIILWAFPVAFVGIISNIQGLCARASWLAWLCKIPQVVIGIIQGILPPVLLAVLMMLLPIVLRLLGRFEGIPTRTGLELSLMTRFFIFQVIHSFLIVTLSSGIIAALPTILQNPSSIATMLAQYLPQASTFFLTYIILQGLSGAAGGFLAVVQLVLYYVKLVILGSTPRSIYNIKYGARTVAWGTLFPSITLLTVITFGYSIISPIINGLAVLAFFLFYQLYKYLFLYQYTQPPSADTGGLFFPKAIQHVFVGLYVQQICLCALFFLAQDQNGKQSAVAEGALMVVLIVFTAGYQLIINNSFGPLISALPLSIADKTYKSEPAPNPPTSGPSTEKRKNTIDSGVSSSPIDTKDPRGSSSSSGQSNEPTDRDDAFFHKHPDGAVDYGFAHPALSKPQRVVWIPDDSLGLGKEEVAANEEAGVKATLAHATMNGKGQVEISGTPVDVDKF
ncbi:hypothetical protein HYDPIDRAFT_176850 [Hydnomerulius pinastri MD-312]|uniref:DUF221-domain-containing protein n=1 Tax=Hydnomerulius pinastri MD-312 TaxID=994086 RepID=A0A0C9W5E1_9AGAM|nr:hypothetical protein HYDPIDRAFT_176850 [Hydnomerulius pinastri MD-312]